MPEVEAHFGIEGASGLLQAEIVVETFFGDDDLETGSVTLRPEQSHNLNLNLSYSLRRGMHHVLAEVGGIFRDTRDYIQRNVIGVGGGRYGASYVNFGRVRTYGLNTSLRYDLGRVACCRARP